MFLHGVTDSSASWDAIAPSFVDDYRVMAVDLRGHGQSDKPATGYSWESDYAKDISSFIPEQLDEPAIVVGHSLGAVVSAPCGCSGRQGSARHRHRRPVSLHRR